MIGASISRWTMSYFAMAVAWLMVALVLMVAGIGFPSADLASRRYARPCARGLHRMAQPGDVRRVVPVRSRSCRKASVLGALGVAGSRSADRRTLRTARGLSGIGRPATVLALAASARSGAARRRFRVDRRRPRVDRVAAADRSGPLRAGRPGLALCDRCFRRDLRVYACGMGWIGRDVESWPAASHCTRSPVSGVG